MLTAQSSEGEQEELCSRPITRRSCQGPHCSRGACREEDDDHERKAAFLHAPGPARAQVSRPALRLGGHAQSLSARPAGTFRSGENVESNG